MNKKWKKILGLFMSTMMLIASMAFSVSAAEVATKKETTEQKAEAETKAVVRHILYAKGVTATAKVQYEDGTIGSLAGTVVSGSNTSYGQSYSLDVSKSKMQSIYAKVAAANATLVGWDIKFTCQVVADYPSTSQYLKYSIDDLAQPNFSMTREGTYTIPWTVKTIPTDPSEGYSVKLVGTHYYYNGTGTNYFWMGIYFNT